MHTPPRLGRLALVLFLAACVQDVGRGPDLGDCAEPPDGPFTFGQIGIGTCLAGPTDLDFVTLDGRSWLAVVNADPFRKFTSGSLTLLSVDDLVFARGPTDITSLEAHALPLEPFAGRLAIDPITGVGVLPSRTSEGSFTANAEDHVWLLDLSEPTEPRYVADRRALVVRQDPYATAMDVAQGHAFVVNSTDHSISILNTRTSPPSVFDPTTDVDVTEPEFDDADGSGSRAELDLEVLDPADLTVTDRWTVAYVDATFRAWLPNADGTLRRWTSGGLDWVPAGITADLDASTDDLVLETVDPWVVLRTGVPTMFFEDVDRIRAASTDGSAASWVFDPGTALLGEPGTNRAFVGGPSVITVGERPLMYVHARATEDGPASIVLATSTDAVRFSGRDTPVLTPEAPYESLEQPAALFDPISGRIRLWASAWDGAQWTIVHAWSTDTGTTFEAPTEVLALSSGEHVAAPWVTWTGGRYRMVLALSDGADWFHATSWSWDGLTWTPPETFLRSPLPFELSDPPRAGVQPDPTHAWRITGEDQGTIILPVVEGEITGTGGRGFSVRSATGAEIDTTVLGTESRGGVEPGSVTSFSGRPLMAVTATDADGRDTIAALLQLGDTWRARATDLIPAGTGGNQQGARAPLLVERDGIYHLYYAAGALDVFTIRHATSSDAVTFTPVPGPVLDPDTRAGWERAEQLPRSLEVTTSGDLRLWYSGFDGSRWRIGSALSTDGGTTFVRELGPGTEHQIGTGRPGTFDDSGVRDPMVYTEDDGSTAMLYAGFDGAQWQIGRARRTAEGVWVRPEHPVTGEPEPVLGVLSGTFAATGVRSPALWTDGDALRVAYAGTHGDRWRVGLGELLPQALFPEVRAATVGDTFTFDTRRGFEGRAVIDLGQVIDGLPLPGSGGTLLNDGPAAAVHDRNRGFLYVVAKSFPGVYVVDVRRDTTTTFDDRNAYDIEAVLRFDTSTGILGVQDIALGDDGRLFLSTREPDAVLIVDPRGVPDDDTKEVVHDTLVGAIGMHDLTDDAGDTTFGLVGAAGLAVVPGRNLLLVPHFRDNSLSVIDLNAGAFGEEIAYLRDIGENPHLVRVSPDRTYAVVANYLGSTNAGVENSGSSLVVIDLREESPTYLQPITRVVNR